MFAGLGAARIRRLFRIARKEAPAIVFIDELDAVGATRGKDISGEKDQTLNQLLVELDGFGSADDVVVIGASTCSTSSTPRCCARPLRPPDLVTAPDLKGRRAILDVHTRRSRSSPGGPRPDRPPDEQPHRCRSGEHLQRGGDLRRPRPPARRSTKDFQAALERVIAGMQSRRVITEHERVVAYHEAGHALCSSSCRRWRRSTGSRSSRAGARSATR